MTRKLTITSVQSFKLLGDLLKKPEFEQKLEEQNLAAIKSTIKESDLDLIKIHINKRVN